MCASLMCFVFAHEEANGRMATVWEFFFFFFFLRVAISQFRGTELLASLQGMWLGALCPGGETGRVLTFPGQQRGMGEEKETF